MKLAAIGGLAVVFILAAGVLADCGLGYTAFSCAVTALVLGFRAWMGGHW